MVPFPPIVIPAGASPAALPQGSAVYLIWPRDGQPHLGRTGILRRRIERLQAKWKLAEIGDRIEIWPTASRLEQWLVSYEIARAHFPDAYERVLRLPKPAYVKLILSNAFPRTQVTTRMAGASSVFFGPFSNRGSAELFEGQFLDLYQLRRCQEDLTPAPDHPGCIYGEMRRCLRPCQQEVTAEEYASEAERVRQFLVTRGKALLDSTAAARDRYSADLHFEEAAREHERHERVEQVVRLAGDLAADVSRLNGVAVTRSAEPDTVLLWFLREGCWLRRRALFAGPSPGKPVSLDSRLRELLASLDAPRPSLSLRQDHLALLYKWYYSSWRDGEWIGFPGFDSVPFRKIVNAIGRTLTRR